MKWYKYIFCPHVFNFVIILNAVKVLVFEWKNTLRNVRVFWMVFAKYSIMSNRTSFKQQLRYIAHPYPHVWKVLVHFFVQIHGTLIFCVKWLMQWCVHLSAVEHRRPSSSWQTRQWSCQSSVTSPRFIYTRNNYTSIGSPFVRQLLNCLVMNMVIKSSDQSAAVYSFWHQREELDLNHLCYGEDWRLTAVMVIFTYCY